MRGKPLKSKSKSTAKPSARNKKPPHLLLIPGEGGKSRKPAAPVRKEVAKAAAEALAIEQVAIPAIAPVARTPKLARRATAEQMASRQRDISISEFFTKNRHLLRFDSPSKA